jgi:hypothetical protein
MANYIRVKLSPEDNSLIERQFYEYNAARDIISYLMQQSNINEDYLQQYINIAEKRFIELEMNKNAVDKHYRPQDINPVNYQFDFEAEELVYEV